VLLEYWRDERKGFNDPPGGHGLSTDLASDPPSADEEAHFPLSQIREKDTLPEERHRQVSRRSFSRIGQRIEKMKFRRPKYPKSPPTDSVDHAATREFEHKISDDWIIMRPPEDKGCDYEVEIKEDGFQTGKRFKVQIKGTTKPTYIEDNRFITHPLRVATIHYLITPTPGMFCVCAVREPDKPIYWIWIQEFIRELENLNPNWADQDSICFRIPTHQKLDTSSFRSIEAYVLKYYDRMAIKSRLAESLLGNQYIGKKDFLPQSISAQRIFKKIILPFIDSFFSADLSDREDPSKIVSLTPFDRALYRTIKIISCDLESLNDYNAAHKLDQIKPQIRRASKLIKSKYYNNLGILSLRNNQLLRSRRLFFKASRLYPKDIKYRTNLLSAEFHIALISGDLRSKLPKGWIERLDRVLKADRNYRPAIILKAEYLSKLGFYDKAITIIKSSSLCKKKAFDTHLIYCSVLFSQKAFKEIIVLLKGIRSKLTLENPIYWALYGDAHLALALGPEAYNPSFEIQGPGPANIDLSQIQSAEICYKKAWDLFKIKVFPKIAEQTVLNYSTTLILQGRYSDCDKTCATFLDYYPDSISVIENNIACLVFDDPDRSAPKALVLAKHAYRIRPNNSRVYQNLILTLHIFEYHDELIRYVLERESKGFSDFEEEGFSRMLLAISFDAIGDITESEKQISVLSSHPEMSLFHTLTKADLLNNHSAGPESILDVLRSSPENIEDERILAKVVRYLFISGKSKALETIEAIVKLRSKRELTPEEYSIYGRVFLSINKPNKAIEIFQMASKRYAFDERFLYLYAIAQYEMGNELAAYTALNRYLTADIKKASIIRDVAILARNIGRLDKSIELFELSLRKADDAVFKSEIHCHLYQLKKLQSRELKEILRHANEYGKLISKENTEDEIRYLLMFIMASLNVGKFDDPEILAWISEYRNRLDIFLKNNPDFPALRVFHVPEEIADEKKGEYIINQLACLTLPRRLAIAPFELSIKSQPWPFAFRAQLLLGYDSIFEYWDGCTRSIDYSHSFHIWTPDNNMELEVRASKEKHICIDINSLLTLAQHDLLSSLPSIFESVILARGTLLALEYNRASPFPQHPLANKIYKWRLDNLTFIRVLKYNPEKDSKEDNGNRAIILPDSDHKGIEETIGFGVGESLMLAKSKNIPLYSDDSIIRIWAKEKYQVAAFSTISLLSRLKNESKIDIATETRFYSSMLNINFNLLPFTSSHLLSALNILLSERRAESLPLPLNDDFIKHEILGSFLKQFEITTYPELALEEVAIQWWIEILKGCGADRQRILEESMKYISFCLCTQRTASGILTGIIKNENAKRAAKLWARFFVRNTLEQPRMNLYSWLSIKENCRNLFCQEIDLQKKILYRMIPYIVIELIWGDKILSDIDKTLHQIHLAEALKYEPDKDTLEAAFAKYLELRRRKQR
jgi:hypothetical protein